MNWVDVIIVVVIGIYLIEGVNRGFFEQLFELIGFFLTIILAAWTYHPLGNWFSSHFGVIKEAADPLAFLVIWVALQALYSLTLRYSYKMLPEEVRKNKINHIAGIVPGLIKALIMLAIILTVTVIAPVPAQLKADISKSYFGSKFVDQSAAVEASLNKIFGRDVKESLTFMTVPPQNEQIIGSNDRVSLKFTTTDVKIDYAAEQKMLDLVNEVRVKNGLGKLVWDEKLAEVARAHSKDMLAKGYFSHVNLQGESPFDRMGKAGISFKLAGENLAYAANVQLAFNGLMNSPEHKENILEKGYGRVGIGVIDGGIYGEMFTQDFTN